MNGATCPGVSFNGAGGVPWYTKQVGGAVIQGNEFSGSTQYIRARGDYLRGPVRLGVVLERQRLRQAAVALVTQAPFDVRSLLVHLGSVHVHQRASHRRDDPG